MANKEGVQSKYGHIKGSECYIPYPIGASEVFTGPSGRFVKSDGSGRAEIAVDGSAELLGHMEFLGTASATEGADVGTLNVAKDAIYRIPINAGTFIASMRGKVCDLAVTSSVQGAKLDGSGEDTLLIVDGDLVNNLWVDVMINPAKFGGTGVV